jgi:integrase
MFDNIHLSNTKKDFKMKTLNDYEIADAIAEKCPKGITPVYPMIVSEESGKPLGVDFLNGPFCVIDETEEDYGLKADSFINASIPDNTRRAYMGDIQYFNQWAIYTGSLLLENRGWPVSEETVLKFIFHHLQEMPVEVENVLVSSGWKRTRGLHSLATVKRRLTSVTILHKFNNLKDPCDASKVKALLSAMSKNAEVQKKSKAITKNVLDNLIETCSGGSLIDSRDKAIMLFGWASGGRRRSEISNAVFENIEETVEGDFIYRIAKSKTDQKGKGHVVPVKGVAAKALREWLRTANITEGKLFRSVSKGGKIGEKITDVDINRIVKKRCEKAGYDPVQYSAHGLRRGFVSEAGKRGCPLGDVMALTGHKSVPVCMEYYESGSVLNNKAADLMS